MKAKPKEAVQRGMFAAMLRQVRRVPRGKVATYGDIAYAAGFPGAARQVAWALHAEGNGLLPWHRIVGAGGKILLTGEHGFEQRMRLQMEGVGFLGLRVNMAAHRQSFAAKPETASAGKAAQHAGAKAIGKKSAREVTGRSRARKGK